MSVSDGVRMHSLIIPPFPLLNKDKSRLSLGINRLAYPEKKSLTLEILRLAKNIELGEEHEDDQSKRLPIVYVQRKRDGWFSRLYIKKENEDSYDVFLFQKNFARINLSDMILQKITNEVKKLNLPIGVTIMDCELCHAEEEGHHHVLRGLNENKIKLYAFDVCVRESNVLDHWSDTYQERSFLLRELLDQSEGNILSFEKEFPIYWNFRNHTVVVAENKPFIDAFEGFVEKNFPCEGFVLKKWNAKYKFSDPVMELRNTDMVKFKLEHTDAYVTRVGLKRREVKNASEAVLYDVIVASKKKGEGICIATVDLDEVRSSTVKSRAAVRQSGAFAEASVKFDVRLKKRNNGTLYVQFVRLVDSDAALEFVPINFGPETSVRYSDNVNDSEFLENVSNVKRGRGVMVINEK
jgi:hypothetical protein